ncbi:MAG TPA: hypothetical protein VLT61_10015 [Anaeromyxobacteraceae bacterium]|nr:hypothetical protein [Anaeromyxobacteraceae bacterium]
MKPIALALALVALAGAALAAEPEKAPPDPRDSGPDKVDVSGYPAEQQRRYAIFEKKCAKCHPVARAINSRFNASEWKRYMKRMIRRPNAGVTDDQADEIYEFLKFYAVKLGVE